MESISVTKAMEEVFYKEVENFNKKYRKNQQEFKFKQTLTIDGVRLDYNSFLAVNSGIYSVIETVTGNILQDMLHQGTLYAVRLTGFKELEDEEGKPEGSIPVFEYCNESLVKLIDNINNTII